MTKTIEERARFDIIRYTSCWEDADILIKALQVKEGGAYLSIASAGDNSLSLLARNPSKVVAIDINPVQLACVELKKLSFSRLSYEELLEFLGVRDIAHRLDLYHRIKQGLSRESRTFWDMHPEYIKRGIIHAGKFERYFHLFRRFFLPLIHNRKTVSRLLEMRNQAERLKFYQTNWNTRRWKLVFKVFFSRKAMGKLGRDPEFFKYVETDVGRRIFKRAEYALTELRTDNNPYLEYILTGNFSRSLPHYLRQENYNLIRANLDNLVIFKGNLQQALETYSSIQFDGFNLSDIFEYMNAEEYREEIYRLLTFSKPRCRLVYWNMLADRKYAEGLEKRIRFLDIEAEELFRQDKAFFYKSLIIGEAV